ncbi:MAG: DNA polymerase III subunit delta [Mycobacteriales bacterium]
MPPSVADSLTAPPISETDALAPLQLLLGDEEFLVARAIAQIVQAGKAAHSGCEITDVVGSEVTPGQWAQLLSPSLFCEHRVLVIRQAHELGKDSTAVLLGWISELPAELVLVISHAGGNRGKALVTSLKAAGARVVPCGKRIAHRDRLAFVRSELRRFGGRVSDDVVSAIVSTVGAGLRELSAACHQLVADTGGDVSAAAVRRYYHGKADVTGFAVADAVMVGDTAAALEALRWAISVGVDPVLVADALADGVRTVARVSSAGRGSAYQLAGALGMPPWKVKRAQRQARGWDGAALAGAMQQAAKVNSAVKGGGHHRVYALERAVLAMTSLRSDAHRQEQP